MGPMMQQPPSNNSFELFADREVGARQGREGDLDPKEQDGPGKGSGWAEGASPGLPIRDGMVWSKDAPSGHLLQAAGYYIPAADSHQQTLTTMCHEQNTFTLTYCRPLQPPALCWVCLAGCRESRLDRSSCLEKPSNFLLVLTCSLPGEPTHVRARGL